MSEIHHQLQPPEFMGEFHRQLGRLVQATAQFDFNVGLQLKNMGEHCDENLGELLDPYKAQLGTRLKRLKRHILRVFEPAGAEVLSEFTCWFARAEEARALRNDYVHGRWGYSVSSETGHQLLNFIPLNWNFDSNSESTPMTLDEFSSQIHDIEVLFSDYFRLVERFKQFARPAS